MSVEERVSRLLLHVRIVEEALHGDPRTWQVGYGPHMVPARREVEVDQVIFTATVPEACYLTRPGEASLWHDGELRSVRSVTAPGDCAFLVRWRMTLADVVAA